MNDEILGPVWPILQDLPGIVLGKRRLLGSGQPNPITDHDR
jgi:hypothetical protein